MVACDSKERVTLQVAAMSGDKKAVWATEAPAQREIWLPLNTNLIDSA